MLKNILQNLESNTLAYIIAHRWNECWVWASSRKKIREFQMLSKKAGFVYLLNGSCLQKVEMLQKWNHFGLRNNNSRYHFFLKNTQHTMGMQYCQNELQEIWIRPKKDYNHHQTRRETSILLERYKEHPKKSILLQDCRCAEFITAHAAKWQWVVR